MMPIPMPEGTLRPGDAFSTFSWTGPLFGELSPTATHPGSAGIKRPPHTPVEIEIPSLTGALRAEIAVEYWGGHIGKSEQSLQVNDGPWIALPQPTGTPGRPECYYRTVLGNPGIEVPLSSLSEGTNLIRFHAGPQICKDFRWGFFWIYACTLRLYYNRERSDSRRAMGTVGVRDSEGLQHPATAQADSPMEIGDNPTFQFIPDETGDMAGVESVDFVGRYYGYNWHGNGRFIDYHYYYSNGELQGTIGRAHEPPFQVSWDTTWIPDQTHPVEVLPVVTHKDGTIQIGRPGFFKLNRDRRSVRMYPASNVPEAFGVRTGEGKIARFRQVLAGHQIAGNHEVTEGPPVAENPKDTGGPRVRDAAIALHTWSAAHADEIGLNGTMLTERVGPVHNYSHDIIPVPAGLIQDGVNTFYLFSRTEEHAAEVNWPGPALLVEYDRAV